MANRRANVTAITGSITSGSKSIFDNNKTLLYKWAARQGVPTTSVIVLNASIDTPAAGRTRRAVSRDPLEPVGLSYITIQDYIQRTNAPTLMALFEGLIPKLAMTLPYTDIYMTWYQLKSTGNSRDDNAIFGAINAVNQRYLGRERFADLRNLVTGYQQWQINQQAILENEALYLATIEDTQQELQTYTPAQLTVPTVKSYGLVIDLVTADGGRRLTSADDIETFNTSSVSMDVPFIAYFETKNSNAFYTKLYNSPDSTRYIDKIIIRKGSLKHEYSLYLSVNNGFDNINNIARSSSTYDEARLSFAESRLYVDVSPLSEDRIIARLKAALPSIRFDNILRTNINAEVLMFRDNIFIPSFLHAITNEGLFSTYLYLNEISQPMSLRKTLKIKYRSGLYDPTVVSTEDRSNAESLTIIVGTGQVIDPTNYKFIDGHEESFTSGQRYITFTIKKSSKRETIDNFVNIFAYLLGAYQTIRVREDSVEPVYLQLFPQLDEDYVLKEIKKAKSTSKQTKLSALEAADPGLFISGYGSDCQSPQQPVLLTQEDAREWVRETFRSAGSTYNRQVMAFPRKPAPGQQQHLVACDSAVYPFPGVRVNKLENKDAYPYLPCCFEINQQEAGAKTDYNRYITGETSEAAKSRAGKVGRVDRTLSKTSILDPYRLGELPSDINQLLKPYVTDSDHWNRRELLRLGIVVSPSSLLHAVCECINDPKYVSLPIEERESYIIQLRKVIASLVNINVVRQELYDLSEEEIRNRLNDPTIFLDPLLFYRAIEEFFNINIYTFTYVTENSTKIEIPRYKIFHTSINRNWRPTILVMKHTGTKRESLSIPQCEPIVDIDKKHNAIKIFGRPMTDLVYNYFRSNNNNLTFSIETDIMSGLKDIIARSRLYSQIDFNELLQRKAFSSWIDDYGKMRALVFKYNNHNITMCCLPSQPEDLPIVANLDELPLASITDVTSLFGQPSFVVRDIETNNVVGLWYRILDIDAGIYMPVTPQRATINVPEGPPSPLIMNKHPSLIRIRRLKRLAALIRRLVEYFYDLYKLQMSGVMDIPKNGLPNSFIKDYLSTPNTIVNDALAFYGLRNIPKSLPLLSEIAPRQSFVENAMKILSRTLPKMFVSNGRRITMILYNKELMDKITDYIYRYHKQTEGLELEPHTRLDLLIDEEDFTQNKNTQVFLTEKDLINWIDSRASIQNLEIYSKLDFSQGITLDPYIYQTNAGKLYLIQNTTVTDRQHALNVAKNWRDSKINLGSGVYKSIIPAQPINDPYIIYGIGLASTAIPIDNKTNGASSYLELLFYGSSIGQEGRYAAMLPLN